MQKVLGLGLAIAKKIVEEHQGHMALKDREGGGAIVEMRFPELEEHHITKNATEEKEDPMMAAVRMVTDGA